MTTTSTTTDPLLQHFREVRGHRVLGPCALLERVGAGGMGTVYRGVHLNLGVEVAVKVVPPSQAAADPTFVERFRREGRSAARINHQNVVRVFDVANDGDLHYLIMEFVRGEDAHQRVQRTGPLPLAEALGIVREACLGLGAAHREGIVHRDVKPANLLISSRGAVKVGDLGLAKPAHGSPDSMVSMAGVAVGTPAFMPPEQWAGTATSATDVWALGSTLFYLLTGTPAFAGDSVLTVMHQITTQPFPDLRQTIADAPDDLVALIEQATASDPAQRFADADAMAAAIDALSVAVGRVEPLNDADALATMSSLPSRAVLDELRAAVEAGEDATPAAEPAADAAGTPERDARNLGTLIKLAVVAVLASATVGAFGGLWVWETCDAGRVAAWQLLAPTMIAVVVFCAPLYVLRRRWFPTRERLQAAIAARTGANS